MMERLVAMPYQSPIWRSSYPQLANILNEDPMAPSGNVIHKNLLVRSGKVTQQMEAGFKKTVTMDGNVETKSDTEIGKFLPVPKKDMGLVNDSIRAKLPPIER